MEIRISPIGTVHNLELIEEKLKELRNNWDNQLKNISNTWWQNYGLKRKASLALATKFLINSLDDLVSIVDGLLDSGPDKKATVLDALSKLYDYIIKEGLPIWLIPFAMPLKNYIIYILASSTIDWMIEKYRNGSWREKIKK
jgi:hypothetical protein